MALALYRKYRPATFAQVVGQEHVTEPLIAALTANRLNHAYLFSGPRGCGKTSSARILARSLNCAAGPTPTPCGECESCVALAPDGPGSVDVIEIDAASHGGVDDARDLRERAFFAPVNSRYKVYIVDEAHMVSTQGFNALLKLVEEPPEFLVFIFATTEPDKVLPTIRSRTHHYPFRLLPPGVMRGLLEGICATEGVAVEPGVLPLVVRAGAGSARDCESILDQLLAGAGPEGVTYQRAVALLGVTDSSLLDQMLAALADGDGAAAFEVIDRVTEAGHDPRRFAGDLLDRLRDLILLNAVPDAAAKGLLDGPDDELARMSEQAGRIGPATLSRFADITHAGLRDMRGTIAPRLVLELLCARMLLPAAATDPAALAQRLERLERGQPAAAQAEAARPPVPDRPAETVTPRRRPTPVPDQTEAPRRLTAVPDAAAEAAPRPARLTSVPDHPAEPEPTRAARPRDPVEPVDGAPVPDTRPPPPAPPVARPTGDLDGARAAWSAILAAVRAQRRSTHALLLNATVAGLSGRELILTIASAPLARRLSESSNVDTIRAALREVLAVDWTVRCVVEGEAPSPARRAAEPAVPDEPAPVSEPPVDADPDTDPVTESHRDESAVALLRSELGALPFDDGG